MRQVGCGRRPAPAGNIARSLIFNVVYTFLNNTLNWRAPFALSAKHPVLPSIIVVGA